MGSMMQAAVRVYRRAAERFPIVRTIIAPVRWFMHFNYVSYGLHRLWGGTFRSWYAGILDAYARRAEPPAIEGQEGRMGQFQLDYLKSQGLRPEHTVLDFGCGYLRAGVYFAQYLDPGRYVGADISQERLNQGRKLLKQMGLEGKNAALICLRDMSLSELAGRSFDVVWAQGVIGHMPAEDIEALLKNVSDILKPSGALYFNYTESEKSNYEWVSIKDVFFRLAFFERLCACHGLQCELMLDWHCEIRDGRGNPHVLAPKDRLLRITPAGHAVATQ